MRRIGRIDVSVIVPCLNEEGALPFFLDSLAGQLMLPHRMELVIVDGGSRDESQDIVDMFEFSHPDLNVVKLVDLTRNMGYVRNLGAKFASAPILFFTNSDAVLPANLLADVWLRFMDPRLMALSGSTVPFDAGLLGLLGYSCFDVLRSFMANHCGKFSPSGNFLAVRSELFNELGGFPQASVNEDGLLGLRISQYCNSRGLLARFDLRLKTGHYAKRFKKGAVKTLLFYSYVFGNFNPWLARLLAPVENSSGEAFKRKC